MTDLSVVAGVLRVAVIGLATAVLLVALICWRGGRRR
jgi:hypothetical protein